VVSKGSLVAGNEPFWTGNFVKEIISHPNSDFQTLSSDFFPSNLFPYFCAGFIYRPKANLI
jgi:hypothetical protein